MELKIMRNVIGMLVVLLTAGSILPYTVNADGHEVLTVDFEEDTSAFVPRGENETVSRIETDASSGHYALLVENRDEAWNGPMTRIEEQVELTKEYLFSVQVKLAEETLEELQLSTQIGEGDNASYQVIDSKTVRSDDWVQLEGTYRYDSSGDNFISVYVESVTNPNVSFYIDDFQMTSTDVEQEVTVQTDLTPLKEVYLDHFLIGNAVSMAEMEGQRLDLLKHHHDLVTTENAMKPEYAYGPDRNFNFNDQDRLVERIKEEGFLLHGHVLVWHQQSPEWLHTEEGELLSRDEALQNMERHIEETVLHYGDDVIAWEVVNEAMNDNPIDPEMWRNMMRRSEWYEAIGDDYLELAYLKTREVLDENGWHDVKLYYNDYNDDNQNKATAIYNMVKEINESYAEEHPGELLIDGIGMQGHYNMGTSVDNVRRSLEQFIELGVEIGVTELDITAGRANELSEEEELDQALLYAELFELYREHSEHISRVTFWGLNDATSWRSENSPLLFDRDLNAKLAYEAVLDPEGFIEQYGMDSDVERMRAEAGYGTPSLSEEDNTSWENAGRVEIDRYQLAWQGASGIGRMLWDEENLYVRIEVVDSILDTSGEMPWEQDSVEVFIHTSMDEGSNYQEGNGQYRVNVSGEETFGETTTQTDIESNVFETDRGYTVQIAIPWVSMDPEVGQQIGFDLQINDARSASRESVAVWNDLSGQGYQDTSVFGELELVNGEQSAAAETNPPNTDSSDLNDLWLVVGALGVLLVLGTAAIAIIKSKK